MGMTFTNVVKIQINAKEDKLKDLKANFLAIAEKFKRDGEVHLDEKGKNITIIFKV